MASVRKDGFTFDRGFQVIMDSYPSVRQHVHIEALAPRYFDAGALLWDKGTFFETKSPLQHPGAVFSDLSSAAFPFADKVRFATIVSSTLLASDYELMEKCGGKDDESTLDYLQRLGCGENMIRRFVQPFFGGVFLDNSLETSKGLFWFYLKKFATGLAFVPAGGVGDFPRQLCSALPPEKVQFGARVSGIDQDRGQVRGIILSTGKNISADHVVLATDEPSTRQLLGGAKQARPHTSVTVVYFESELSLYDQKLIVLPAGADRLVRHFVQITNIAPEYAPAGRHLLSATILDRRSLDDDGLSKAAMAEIVEVFPAARRRLRLIAMQNVPYATLKQPAGFAGGLTSPAALENLHFAGDQVSSSSIEAAMHSGQQAAMDCLSPRN